MRKGKRSGVRSNPNDMMKQVQKMQEEMARVQEETTQEAITISSGGGMVVVTITGGLEIQSISIKPEVVDPDDIEMLEDLILTATNEAIQKAQSLMETRMSALTGGLNIPGLF
jgi:DNA-binding YbaB/EbfC family protein